MKHEYELLSLPESLKDEGWDELLKYWAEMINQYILLGDSDLDVPFWYGERAITGILAAASWKLEGGWSLEEFIGLRRAGLKKKAGRGDLWLGTGKGKYTIEAKILWARNTWQRAVQQAREKLKEASNQLKALDQEFRYGTCIALCYVVPEPHKNYGYSNRLNMNEFFDELTNAFSGKDFIVATYRLDPPPEYDDRLYPGLVIVGSVVNV